MLIFIDDSGDPGFRVGAGSSAIFVIALVIFPDSMAAQQTEQTIKKLRARLDLSDIYEFKFNWSGEKNKRHFFEAVKAQDFTVRAIVVRKEDINSPHVQSNKRAFYNFIIMRVLRRSTAIKQAMIRIDKYGDKALRDGLRVYLSSELDNKHTLMFTDLKFIGSKHDSLIQLADMVAGSIFAAHSGKDKSYLQTLLDAGRIEDIWFFT